MERERRRRIREGMERQSCGEEGEGGEKREGGEKKGVLKRGGRFFLREGKGLREGREGREGGEKKWVFKRGGRFFLRGGKGLREGRERERKRWEEENMTRLSGDNKPS